MKQILKFLLWFTLLVLFFSCSERKNPILSEPGYSIVANMNPIGVFRSLCLTPSNAKGYISADYIGLLVLDLQNPNFPVIIDTLKNPLLMGIVRSAFVSEVSDLVYVESTSALIYPNALKIFALDSINTMANSLGNTASAPLQKFMVREFTHDSAGITIVDSINIYISDPTETSLRFSQKHFLSMVNNTFVETQADNYAQYTVYDFALQDSLAYLAVDEYGMQIVDLNSIYYLSVIGSFDSEGFCRGIDVAGNYCYMADRSWGLQILDVSTPTNPVRVSNLRFPGADDCEKVKVLGDRAVLLDIYNGIYAIDISDRLNPQLLFNFDTITPTDIVLTEDFIYVVDEDAGLVIASW